MQLKEFQNHNIEVFSNYDDLIKVIGIKLSDLIKSNHTDMTSLSLYTGISLSSLHKLKRGVGNPTLSSIFRLANFFGAPITFFFSLNDKEVDESNFQTISVFDLDTYGTLESDEKLFIQKNDLDDIDFCIKINTTAFSPIYDKGMILNISKNSEINSGDIIFVSSKYGNSLRRMLKIDPNTNIYLSLDKSSSIDDFNEIKVYGKVIEISR